MLQGVDKKNPQRVNRAEPVPSMMPIEAPDHLDADARAVWDRVAPDLERKGVLTMWDTDALAVYCTAVVHHRRAAQMVNDRNVLIASSRHDDAMVKHPAMQVLRDQAAIIRTFAGEFGLTPSARSSLVSPSRKESSAERLLS